MLFGFLLEADFVLVLKLLVLVVLESLRVYDEFQGQIGLSPDVLEEPVHY